MMQRHQVAGVVAFLAATWAALVLVAALGRRRSSELMSVQGHKSYYYNVFGNIDERFDNALKARKQEERTALAIHSFPGREISLAAVPRSSSHRPSDNRVQSLEREVAILSADLNSVKRPKLSTCPADIPVCSSANQCKTCPLQCGGFCQSLTTSSCGLDTCVTCPVGMKLAATSDLSTGNCVPCLHSWYDTSTGKIIDTACNGGSYLSRTGTFTLASRCTLDYFGKASCAVGPARPSAAGGPPRLNVKALPTGPTHPGLASQRLQWANEALRALQAAPAGRNAKAKPTALSKAGRRRPTMVLADAAAGSAAGAAVSTSVTNTDVDAVRTHATYRHSTSEGSPWFRTLHNGDRAASLTTTEQDDNPIAQLKPGDYWKDPYERKYLKGPDPHDPASTLAHTVTGDYASPATWGNIYRDKETLDWCVEEYPWFEDRIKCIRTLHASGPLLN